MAARSDLPEDLVTNILVRLPVKSLIRFKCVDTSWDALFKTPSFINNHHTQMQIRRNHEELLMIGGQFESCCMTIISDSQSVSQVDLKQIFPAFDSRDSLDQYLFDIHLYGPSNGVFGLYVVVKDREEYPDDKLILWNPATREVKVLPPPSNGPTSDDLYFALRGFGADPNANELKFVYLNMDPDLDDPQPPSTEIYSVATNSWTLIPNDNVPLHFMLSCPKKYLVNGVCYWMNILHDPSGNKILCFDFRNNRFRKVEAPPPPHILENTSHMCDFLTEVNDSVAYVLNMFIQGNPGWCKVQMWILERDRWTKMYNLGPFEGPSVSIFAIWKGGAEFLGVSDDGCLVLYNSDGQPVRHFHVLGHLHMDVRKYVESIAPLSL